MSQFSIEMENWFATIDMLLCLATWLMEFEIFVTIILLFIFIFLE